MSRLAVYRALAAFSLLAWWMQIAAATDGSPLAAPSTRAGATFQECEPECPLMVVLPAGTFSMGTDRLDIESDGREGPPHVVKLAKPLAIGVYDVTRGEFARFVRATGYRTMKGCNVLDTQGRWITDNRKSWRDPGFAQTDRDPVVCVSWNDAQAYATWLNTKLHASDPAHGPYRLPSEAEWEYAARAGSSSAYYWGDEPSHDLANYGIEDCAPCGAGKEGRDRWYFTSPVGSFPPNAFGLYDASGNVWQITQDCTHYGFEEAPADGTAWMSDPIDGCYNHTVRGGSWLDPGVLLTVFVRNPWATEDHNYANGFRVARTLE
jgi:formylglycine-generating enzyme